jgi:hypothetical protein
MNLRVCEVDLNPASGEMRRWTRPADSGGHIIYVAHVGERSAMCAPTASAHIHSVEQPM